MDEKKPLNPLDNLRGVVDDLWGTTFRMNADNAAQLSELTRALERDPGVVLPGAQTEAPDAFRTSIEPAPAPKPAFPPFETLWKVADETVDWTDALAYDHPVDGLTSATLWAFFHEHAEAVLDGELPAYLDVLRAANPLGDLKPFARSFNVKAVNADRLVVSFDALPGYMEKTPAETRRYLSGVALRCARDLMALLPVREVLVEARSDGQVLLTVPFTRAELQKVRFSFVDPELFAVQCGGQFA